MSLSLLAAVNAGEAFLNYIIFFLSVCYYTFGRIFNRYAIHKIMNKLPILTFSKNKNMVKCN